VQLQAHQREAVSLVSNLPPVKPIPCSIISCLEHAQRLLDAISWDPAIKAFFGQYRKHPIVAELFQVQRREEGDGSLTASGEHGYLLTWHYEKANASHRVTRAKTFVYNINIYIPNLTTVHRALELILEKHVGFMRHEMQECFLFDGKAHFDPHPQGVPVALPMRF